MIILMWAAMAPRVKKFPYYVKEDKTILKILTIHVQKPAYKKQKIFTTWSLEEQRIIEVN